jgi:hypothetical protein
LKDSERRTEPGPKRSSNEVVLPTLADAGAGLIHADRSKSVTQTASPSAMKSAAPPKAASRSNRIPRLVASPAALVVFLPIYPRLGASESRLIPNGFTE